MNTYRRLLAQEIKARFGYDRYPFEWNVGLYHLDLSPDNIFEKVCKEYGPMPPLTGALERFEGPSLEDQAIEDARSSLGDDGYSQPSPHVAARYGLAYAAWPRKFKRIEATDRAYYPSARRGWALLDPYVVKSYSVEFELMGRMGKHLVVTKFEGVDLRGLDADDLLLGGSGYYDRRTNKWCQALLAMLHEWDLCFSNKTACEAVEHAAAWIIYQEQEDRATAWRNALTAAREERRRGEGFQLKFAFEDPTSSSEEVQLMQEPQEI